MSAGNSDQNVYVLCWNDCKAPPTHKPQDVEKRTNGVENFRARTSRDVALNRPKHPSIRDILGDLRATIPALEKFSAELEVFCFRGWKSPQGLYNRSKFYLGGHFAPEKKIFSPPPRPNSLQTPTRPPWPHPPPSGRPPPLGFSTKNRPPPLPVALDSPLPLPEQKKIKKYSKRPQSFMFRRHNSGQGTLSHFRPL